MKTFTVNSKEELQDILSKPHDDIAIIIGAEYLKPQVKAALEKNNRERRKIK